MILIEKNAVKEILEGKENSIIDIVKEVYILFEKKKCSLPDSVFLKFPHNSKNRIICLPAYVGGDINNVGMKWISSFPENINKGKERATAIIALNDLRTGEVNTIMSGTDISAKRTAASAVAAAICLHQQRINEMGFVGCGRINTEILNMMMKVNKLEKIYLLDTDEKRIHEFITRIKCDVNIEVVEEYNEIFSKVKLISFATTATSPYLDIVENVTPEHTILGVSLRDFSANFIMSCTNIVDSIEHVNRENTSINLAYLKYNNLEFIQNEIGNVYSKGKYMRDSGKAVLFSPFGLGVLDIALADYVKKEAIRNKKFIEIDEF